MIYNNCTLFTIRSYNPWNADIEGETAAEVSRGLNKLKHNEQPIHEIQFLKIIIVSLYWHFGGYQVNATHIKINQIWKKHTKTFIAGSL